MEERNAKIADLTYELMQGLSKEIVSALYYTEVQEDGSISVETTPFGSKIEKRIINILDKNL